MAITLVGMTEHQLQVSRTRQKDQNNNHINYSRSRKMSNVINNITIHSEFSSW